MNESSVTLALRKVLEKGMAIRKVSDRFNAGILDLFGSYGGRSVVIEMKVHPNKLTELQKHTADEFAANGAAVLVITYYKPSRSFECLNWASGTVSRLDNKEGVSSWVYEQSSSNIKPRQSSSSTTKSTSGSSLSLD